MVPIKLLIFNTVNSVKYTVIQFVKSKKKHKQLELYQDNKELNDFEQSIQKLEERKNRIKHQVLKILKHKIQQYIDSEQFKQYPQILDVIENLLINGQFSLNLQIPIDKCCLLNLNQLFILLNYSIEYTFFNDNKILIISKSFLWQIMKPYFKKDNNYKKFKKMYKQMKVDEINLQLNSSNLSQHIEQEFTKANYIEKIKSIIHYFSFFYLYQYRKLIKHQLIHIKQQLTPLYYENRDNFIEDYIRQQFKNLQEINKYFQLSRLEILKSKITYLIQFKNQRSQQQLINQIQKCLKDLSIRIESLRQFNDIQNNYSETVQQNNDNNNNQNEILDIIYLFLLGIIITQNENKQIEYNEYFSNMRTTIKYILNSFSGDYEQIQIYQTFEILKICENVAQEIIFQKQLNINSLNSEVDQCCQFNLISNSQKIYRKSITICISGFLTENETGTQWKELCKFDDSIILYLKWGSSNILKCFAKIVTGLNLDFIKKKKNKGEKKFKKKYESEHIQNFQELFIESEKDAYKVGQQLSNLIKKNYFDGYTLNFVGHSLGTRVIQTMIKDLDETQSYETKNFIDTILLLGGAVDIKDLMLKWNCVQGEIINVYSKHDTVLKLLYTACHYLDNPCGLYKIPQKFKNIRNINLSSLIPGHTHYYEHLKEILVQVDFYNNIRILYEIIDYQLDENNTNEILESFQ